MARDWYDLFLVDGGGPGRPAEPEREEGRRGFFRRLRENMRKTREALSAEVQATLFENLDDETWERLEEALIYADVGARTTAQVVEQLEREAESGELTGGEALTRRLSELLADMARTGDDHIDIRPEPTVILVVGVNGTGKTTTIGKLAWHLQRELGKSVVLGAADTFRAAAVEQLRIWGEQVGVPVIAQRAGADPGAVAFDAVAAAESRNLDAVLVDTAGRLQNKQQLMDELAKIRRVIERRMPGQPRHVLLVLDATTGQNGILQAEAFSREVGVTGIVLTKLDGSAKGGVALAASDRLGVPIVYAGMGEEIDALAPFDPDAFVEWLLAG
jgi:fused signal recognition particle receptor